MKTRSPFLLRLSYNFMGTRAVWHDPPRGCEMGRFLKINRQVPRSNDESPGPITLSSTSHSLEPHWRYTVDDCVHSYNRPTTRWSSYQIPFSPITQRSGCKPHQRHKVFTGQCQEVVHISSSPILLNETTSARTRVSGLSSQVWTLMEALSGSTAMCHSDKLLFKHFASKWWIWLPGNRMLTRLLTREIRLLVGITN